MQEKLDQAQLLEAITAAKNGDETAFTLLYEHYFNPLHRYILIRVSDSEEADDLTQQVFIKFYRNLANWEDKGFAPSAYLYTIARSVIADYYRAGARKGKKIKDSEEVLGLIADTSHSPHSNVIQQEEIRTLYHNLRKLPQAYQEVLLLRYIQNFSSQDIAQVINKSDVATRKMLSRAVAALSKISKEEEKSI